MMMVNEWLREKLNLLVEGELDELYSDIFVKELEEVLEEINVFDLLFLNDTLTDKQKVDDLLEELSTHDSERVEKMVSRLILTSQVLPLLDDKRYVEDVWLAVGEDEVENTERILDFTFPADFKWFYSNFMSIRTEGFDLIGFSSSCVEIDGDEHPLVSANRIYKEGNKICFGVRKNKKYFIDQVGHIYIKQKGFLDEIDMGFSDLIISFIEKKSVGEMLLVERLKREMNLWGEEKEFFELLPNDEIYKNRILESFNDFVEYIEFVNSNKSIYFSLFNPNMDFKAEDYLTLYSPSEGKSVKDSIYDWKIDEELLILGCIGQETYLFSYGKEIYAFPQYLEYEPENLIYIAPSLQELLTNTDAFNQAMKYSDRLQRYFDDEEYMRFIKI